MDTKYRPIYLAPGSPLYRSLRQVSCLVSMKGSEAQQKFVFSRGQVSKLPILWRYNGQGGFLHLANSIFGVWYCRGSGKDAGWVCPRSYQQPSHHRRAHVVCRRFRICGRGIAADNRHARREKDISLPSPFPCADGIISIS